ncbi:MAG: endospore germination permease [Bacillaceae bacterium]|nr:endospore germination permease [Bacillaceae bacterium]
MASFHKQKADRVSTRQLGWMLITVHLATGITFAQRSIAEEAGKGGWLSIALAGAGGLLILYLILKTHEYYPNQSLVQYARSALGKWVGGLVALIYLGVLFYLLMIITYEAGRIAEFNYIYVYISPIILMGMAYIFLVLYMVTGGIAIVARVNDFVYPIFFLLIAMALLLNIPFIKMDRMLPMVPADWNGVMKAVPIPLLFFVETTLLSLLWPYCRENDKVKKGLKDIGRALLISTVGMTIIFLSLIVTFGEERTSYLEVPIYYLAREIFFGQFLSNFQILLLPVMFGSIIIKISVFVFALSSGIQDMGFKKSVWVIPSLVSIMAIVSAYTFIESSHQMAQMIKGAALWVPPFFFIMHLVLFIAARRNAKNHSENQNV